MTDYSIHRPSFTGTTRNDWTFPTEQDFDTDDLSTVASRFLVSASGFEDPESYDDLYLPVVNHRNYLSLNALFAARDGPYSDDRISDMDPETRAELDALIDDLGTEHFVEYQDVVVSDADWAAATDDGPANPAGGVLGDAFGQSKATYSPTSASIGLAFLAVAALALNWIRGRR